MSNIFDLAKVSKLVDSVRPRRILVFDTNVVMDSPDSDQWTVEAGGESLFILSDTVFQELQIHQRQGGKEKDGSPEKAARSVDALVALCRGGRIADGIQVRDGWVVSVPSPRKNDLQPELEQLCDIVNAFGRWDTKLLLLTRECHRLFQSTPVTMVTKERDLFVQVEGEGVPCYLWTGFPIEGLREASAIDKPVDWDGLLEEVNTGTRQKSVVVEATLTGARAAPEWTALLSGTKKFTIAEGRGVLRMDNEVKPFTWAVPYYQLTIESDLANNTEDNEGLVDVPLVHLDFFGQDSFDQDLFDQIADRLMICAQLSFDEGRPTLQSPRSVMEMLLFLEQAPRSESTSSALESVRKGITESGGLAEYCAECIFDNAEEEDQYALAETLLFAVANCWKPGQTYQFSVVLPEKERGES